MAYSRDRGEGREGAVFLVETVLLSYLRKVAIADSGDLVVDYSRKELCGCTSLVIN